MLINLMFRQHRAGLRLRNGMLFAVSSLAIAAQAPAAMLLYDGFNYTPSANLSNQMNPGTGTPWLRPTSPAGSAHTISAGTLSDPDLKPPTGNSVSVPRVPIPDSYNRLTIPGTHTRASGETLYFSFLMRLDDLFERTDADLKTTGYRRGGFIAGLHGGAASTTTAMSIDTGFAMSIYVRQALDLTVLGSDGTPGAQTGEYEIGVMKRGGTSTNAPVYNPAATVTFGEGETVLIVGQYDIVDLTQPTVLTNDVVQMWVNPTPGAPMGAPSLIVPAGQLNMASTLGLASVFLKSDSFLAGNFTVDEVRVGQTYDDVLPVVPEPGTMALGLVASAVAAGWRRSSHRGSNE